MKYKNYKNPYTKEDKIYSRENMLDMSLWEIMSRKDELLAQTDVLGIPEEEELKNSENAVYVEAYTRDDGTEVKAHWRSKPNGNLLFHKPDSTTGSVSRINKIFEKKNQMPVENYLDNFIESNIVKLKYYKDLMKETLNNTKSKYEGLSSAAILQKALSKAPILNTVENEYYRNSLKLKDGEPLTKKFLEENEVYSYKDITNVEKRNYYKEKLSKMHGYNVKAPDIDMKLADKKLLYQKKIHDCINI